jgi:phenylacetate-coenzyme A ligase PaaK-like adenylate-forming protein
MDLRMLFKTLGAIRQLRQHEIWTRSQLEAHQSQALQGMRHYAYAHSPFYQRFHYGLYDRPLNELPVLKKATLMEHFDDLVTDRAIHLNAVRAFAGERLDGRLFLDCYRVTATSGSSGQPGFFLFDEPEWLTIMASFARGQEWSGARINLSRRRKMATVASISPWHMSSQVAATAQTPWTPSIRLPASDPLESIVQRLNDWQPDILIGYASMARILAEEQNAGRLHIHPAKTFTSSEVLTDETRRRVKTAWGDEPFNQYGATETADIAAERRDCRRMHLFEDLVLTEVVDDAYRPVPAGTYGAHVLITTLFSRTQPLIRYELNDSIRLASGTCPSGHVFGFIDGVQGRVEDSLRLPALTGGRRDVEPLVFNRIMDILPVTSWQVAQEDDDGLTVLVSAPRQDFASESLAGQLNQTLAEQGVRVPYINVRVVPAIPKTLAGKTPLIRRAPNASHPKLH